MYYPQRRSSRRLIDNPVRTAIASLGAFFLLWTFYWHSPLSSTPAPVVNTPLVDYYIGTSKGSGGRWYIPDEWYEGLPDAFPDLNKYQDLRNPREPAEAAQQALDIALRRKLFINGTNIPLIVHQTWKDCGSDTWSDRLRVSAESWLEAATGESTTTFDKPRMSYIFWDDEGIAKFFALYEPKLAKIAAQLPYPVEKADIFRVAVLKWFGGVYADIDTSPLLHPSLWVNSSLDLAPWTDVKTQQTFTLHAPATPPYTVPEDAPFRPHPVPDSPVDITPATYKKIMNAYKPNNTAVGAILGLEADSDPQKDDYWRAGYTYPVQLTNWAFAIAPHHPIATQFLEQVGDDVTGSTESLNRIDPLDLTGPPAFTRTVIAHCEADDANFRWEGLSGATDPVGGRGKVAAGDILVLPITGFSPGRGSWNNMGSQALTHPSARLYHAAAGSWRKKDLKVTAGKLCRTLFGACKEWSKIPET